MSTSGNGKYDKPIQVKKTKKNYNSTSLWFPPQVKHENPVQEGKLLIYNTLTREKNIFVQ